MAVHKFTKQRDLASSHAKIARSHVHLDTLEAQIEQLQTAQKLDPYETIVRRSIQMMGGTRLVWLSASSLRRTLASSWGISYTTSGVHLTT